MIWVGAYLIGAVLAARGARRWMVAGGLFPGGPKDALEQFVVGYLCLICGAFWPVVVAAFAIGRAGKAL